MASVVKLVAVVVLAAVVFALLLDEQDTGMFALSLDEAVRGGRAGEADGRGEAFSPVATTWEGEPHHEPGVPLRTPADVPAPPPAFEVVPEPLEWTWYEPPYLGMPVEVLEACQAFITERMDPASAERSGPQWGDPAWYQRHVGRGRLASGVEVWVQITQRLLGGLSPATIHLRDPLSGVMEPEAIPFEARWGSVEIEDIPGRILQADLDGDGRVELVVEEQHHSGTDHWEWEYEWYDLDRRLAPERLLQSLASTYQGLMGWSGSMGATVHRSHANELILRGWYWPRDGETDPLGYSVLRRDGPGMDYRPVYAVVDPRGTRQRNVHWTDEPQVPGWHFAGYR